MKARRVIVTIEMETDATIADIKDACWPVGWCDFDVHQIQVNVVRTPKPKPKRDRKP